MNEYGDQCHISTMNYLEWNKLMPVWLKILKMHSEEFGTLTSTCEINNIGCTISAKDRKSPNIARLGIHGTVTIQDIYDACLEYIKWYNQQTPPNGN